MVFDTSKIIWIYAKNLLSFYLDTCIWRDFYEARFGQRGNPLGKYAGSFFSKLIKDKTTIYFSDHNIIELRIAYGDNEVNEMFNLLFFIGMLKKADVKKEDYAGARKISAERGVPPADALHALIARNCKAIMVTRDRHFEQLKDIVEIKKPEEI